VRDDEGEKEKTGCMDCAWMYNCQSKYLFFLAMLTCSEWGDKSQIAAISLALKAKTMEVVAVAIGGSLGHLTCISIALLFGKIVKQCMSENVLALIGSLLFLAFGLWELIYELILGNYKEIDPFKL
jgi:putative Ca2+/H+ antiporter (TMEM165/GDT1 family)